MNICLVNPPIEDFYTTGIRRQPLGLLYIAAALKDAGFPSSLINCHTKKRSPMELPEEFRYLEEYMSHSHHPVFPFAGYAHYGMSWQETEKRIKESNAGLFLVSSMFTTYCEETARIITIIRKFHTHAVIAAGGHHASLHPGHLLACGADFVIHGEGELPAAALARTLAQGGSPGSVPGISWLENGAMKSSGSKTTPDISSLAIPDRGLMNASSMRGRGKNFVTMITSRGCPNRCGFCTSRIVWGGTHRQRPCEDIMAEVRHCIEKHGAEIINFEDDNLFPSRERALELLEAFAAERMKHSSYPELAAMNGISIEKLDEDIIMLMKRAGFRELDISLVSHSNEVQKRENRPFSSEQFMKIAACAKKLGFNVRGYFILGLPGQSVAEADETISFMKKSGISVYPSVYYNVFAPQHEWKMQRSSAFFNERDDFPRPDLVRCFNRCRVQD